MKPRQRESEQTSISITQVMVEVVLKFSTPILLRACADFRLFQRISMEREPYIASDMSIEVGTDMSEDIRYYKGKSRVRVLAESNGSWVVEALEPFEDEIQGQKEEVKTGERRIVAPNLLFLRKGLLPPIKEHAYELKMEKKLKRLIAKEEKKSKD